MINLEMDCLLDHYIHVPQVLPRSIHLKAQKGHFMAINKKSCLPRDPLTILFFFYYDFALQRFTSYYECSLSEMLLTLNVMVWNFEEVSRNQNR